MTQTLPPPIMWQRPTRAFVDLALAGLAAQLQRRLPDLRQAGRTAGMAARDQPAVGRDRHAAAELEVAALDARLGLALAAEAEQLVVLELLDGEGVVHLHEVDVLRADARPARRPPSRCRRVIAPGRRPGP